MAYGFFLSSKSSRGLEILAHFRDLQVRGPPRGHFSEPTNSILVAALRKVARAKELFWGMGLKVVTGSFYLEVFISEKEVETTWLASKVQGWT